MANEDREGDFDDALTVRPAVLGRIDRYELVRELGGGGFGCVYLARDMTSLMEVAVKGLPPEVKHNREELENVRANFALIAPLHHPNIAASLVLHPVEKTAYASRDVMEKLRVFEGDMLQVMEYAPGMTLSSWRKQFPEGRVPCELAADVVRQVAQALDYAHSLKIVHRDVKPANVMVDPQPDGSVTVKVLDFGLAAEIRSSMGRLSREIRDTSGTRPYMAPEQWTGDKQGPATDQYALAVLFCELLSGEIPFQSAFDTGDLEVMRANVVSQPVRLPEAVPARFRKSLLRALSKRPAERFARCSDLVARPSRRLPVVLLGSAALVAAAFCVLFRPSDRPQAPSDEPSPAASVTNVIVKTVPGPVVPAPVPRPTPGSVERPVSVPVSNSVPETVPPVPEAKPVERSGPAVERTETDDVSVPRPQPQPEQPKPVLERSVSEQPKPVSERSVSERPKPVSERSVSERPVSAPVPVAEPYPLSRAIFEGAQSYETDYQKLYRTSLAKAARGDADAQFCLGWMHWKGLGTHTVNLPMAKKYLKKSAGQGNGYALKLLKEMGD